MDASEPADARYLLTCHQCSEQPNYFASNAGRRDWAAGHIASTDHRQWTLREETADGRWYGGYIAVEPPAEVTRVRSLGTGDAAVRGAECEFCGPGHSHWAYVPVGNNGRPPSPDSSKQDEGGWHCWLDLDTEGPLVDDTENDNRSTDGT